MVYYVDKMTSNGRVTLQMTELPAGIIQVLLLDKEMNPLSERLVNRVQEFAKVELIPDQEEYGRRALVKMDVKIEVPSVNGEIDGNDVGSFAMTVTDDRDVTPDTTLTLASYCQRQVF